MSYARHPGGRLRPNRNATPDLGWRLALGEGCRLNRQPEAHRWGPDKLCWCRRCRPGVDPGVDLLPSVYLADVYGVYLFHIISLSTGFSSHGTDVTTALWGGGNAWSEEKNFFSIGKKSKIGV